MKEYRFSDLEVGMEAEFSRIPDGGVLCPSSSAKRISTGSVL